jgi:thymidylate synthase
MTEITNRYIAAPDLSHGWLETVRLVAGIRGRKAVHVIVRIDNPTIEDRAIRAAAQNLIDRRNATSRVDLPDIDTTRNTIFPAAWARRTAGPAELAAYYRERYTKDGLLGFNQNGRGTYFGRIVAFPRENGEPADQLTDTVRKIKAELAAGSNKSSRYEISIYNERKDRSPMSFPCLAHLSVHLHERQVHLQAIYRNEYLVARAYGNYVGLAELQSYIAHYAGAATGELLMTLGHVELETGNMQAVKAMLTDFRA